MPSPSSASSVPAASGERATSQGVMVLVPTASPAPEAENSANISPAMRTQQELVPEHDFGSFASPDRKQLGQAAKHFQYRRVLHDLFFRAHFSHPAWLPRGSSVGTAFNLASATIGVGTLAMPYAMMEGGAGFFLAGSIVVFAFLILSLKWLCDVVDVIKVHSFEMMTRTLLGSHRGEVAVEVLLVLSCFGSSVVYIIVVGDIAGRVRDAFAPDWTHGGLIIQVLVALCVMYPLSLLRTLTALKYASVVGITGISILVIAIVYNGIRFGTVANISPMGIASFSSSMQAIPLLFFATSNQVNAVELYAEMSNRSATTFLTIATVVCGSIGLIFIGVAFAGLSAFGVATKGNVLNNFTVGNDVLITLAFVGIAVKTILTFPLMVYPMRDAIFHMAGVENTTSVSFTKWAVATTVLCGGSLVAAIVVPSITVLFGLIGSLSASLFGFILPALFALALRGHEKMKERPAASPWEIAAMYGTFAVGIFVAVVGTAYTVMGMLQ